MNILKIKEFKAFREVSIRPHKTTHCANQSCWATLSPVGEKWTDHNWIQAQMSMVTSTDISSVLPRNSLHWPQKQLSVTRCLKWGEVNSTCSFFRDSQPFNCTETYTRGCQSVVHSLPTPHTQFTCGLVSKAVNQHSSLLLRDSAACDSCARPMPQTGILTFAVQTLVCVYRPRRFRCTVCRISKFSYCWNRLPIPVL